MYDNYGHNQVQTPVDPPPPQKVIRFDRGYIRSTQGVLKIIQLLTNFIGFICIKIQWSVWISSIFYNLLYWIAIIITGSLFLLYMFHLVEKFDKIPWYKLEFFYCGLVVITYIVLSIIATTLGENTGFAVGFFGFVAVIAYGYDGYTKYKGWKRGLPPQ